MHAWRVAAVGLLAVTVALSGCSAKDPETKSEAPPATGAEPARPGAIDIRRNPTDLPGPISRRTPERVVVSLETTEVDGRLQDGTTYTYWTFNSKVPGPMIRARVGDTVELHLKNNDKSMNGHSIDLHAVSGPGGGAVSTQVKAGEEKSFSFKALYPGVYVYHCASPHIPTHIAQGMYGLIVIEPEEGLPKVDHEFYVMQGELYTSGHPGDKGHLGYNGASLLDERPNFVVFNGAFQGLTGDLAMKVRTGETVRLFMGNGGPNLVSSFHVIGAVFEKVHREGGSGIDQDIQTTLIPAGGASWVELTLPVPGNYVLVDHSITRAVNKGAMAVITAEGEGNDEVYKGHVEPGSGH